MTPVVALLSFLASLALSFLMSGMEAGVFAMSRLRIRQHVRAGNPRAAALLGYLESPERFLWTILVGNTLANITAVSLLVLTLHHWLGASEALFWVSLGAAVILFYALCDLLPKMLFRTYPNRLSMMMAVPFRIVDRTLRPLVWLVELVSRLWLRCTGGARFTGHLFGNRDELRLLMQETGQSLSSEERAMINRVLDLQSRSVEEIMVPLESAVMLPAAAPVSELLRRRREHGFSRYPVFGVEGGQRRVLGFVNSKSVLYEQGLNPERPVSDFLKPLLFMDSTLRLDAALRQMQRTGQRLGVVLGADKREIGMVCLTDVLQAIFGEVRL